MIEHHFKRSDGVLVLHRREDISTFAEVMTRWVNRHGTKLPYDYEPPRRPKREVER